MSSKHGTKLAAGAKGWNGSKMTETGFPCSANPDAEILILGSMPSVKSLAKAQYYAHPQNAFWPIMAEMFGFDTGMDYEKRLESLRNNRVALWDVAHQCVRPGSLDSAIDIQSVVANDFDSFFNTHPEIQAVFFNGRKAEDLYRRLVLHELPKQFRQLERHLLPSTSPANAGLSRSDKLKAWKIIKAPLEKD